MFFVVVDSTNLFFCSYTVDQLRWKIFVKNYEIYRIYDHFDNRNNKISNTIDTHTHTQMTIWFIRLRSKQLVINNIIEFSIFIIITISIEKCFWQQKI